MFHELAHIVLGHVGLVNGTSDEDEKAADKWSEDTLINSMDFEVFKKNGDFSEKSVIEFATSQGIAPGIVVGRMQMDRLVKYNMLNNLKNKVNLKIS